MSQTAGATEAAPVAAPELRRAPFLAGLSLVTGSTLALEVLDTRLLSVVTWYSLAFLVIAMGLFGLTAGAVRVYLSPEDYAAPRLPSSLARDARRMCWAIPGSYLLVLILPLRTAPVATTAVLFLAFAAALALPFYPAGLVTAAAVTRARFPIGALYAVDLLGAALGAPLVPLLLGVLDAGTAILAVAAITAVAAACFAWSGSDRPAVRHALLAAAVMTAAALVNGSTRAGLQPLWIKGEPQRHETIELELWNSHSRIDVLRPVTDAAVVWGPGTRCPPTAVTHRMLVIDGNAQTPLYDASAGLGFLGCDVTNAVHALHRAGPIAIVGVGGGRDLQAALLAGHRPVWGIELNGRLLEVLRGPLGRPTGVADHPDVRLVHDEARAWLERTPERFRVVQMSLIDTWAATGAGAHTLSENGLYTREAWRLLLERLEPGGLLTVSRWYSLEATRLVALATTALLDRGVREPRRHVALLRGGDVVTLIAGRDPLAPGDEQRLTTLAQERGFQLLALPSLDPRDPAAQPLRATSLTELDAMALGPLFDLRAPSDDRPFFFNALRLAALWTALPPAAEGVIEGNLLATRALELALLASLALLAVAVVLPLWRRARPRRRSGARLWAGLVYFAAIGMGFMLAEIAMLQRLSLLLGHPLYSLVVVLSSLIAFAGLGSLGSDRLPLDRAPWRLLYPVALAGVVGGLGVGWPALLARLDGAGSGARIAFAVGCTGLLGLVLGVAFPAGMRLFRSNDDEESPWFWGMNGVGSVLGSSVALLVALELGLTAVMVCSAWFYLLLVPAIAARHR